MSYYILSKCCSKNIRHSFTDKEDDQLKKLVLEYGEHDWKTIADNLGTRTPRQCRERYRNYLMPGIVNGPWTVDDDMLLYSKFLEIGPHWTIISQFFPSRSEINIKNRWTALSNKRNNKNLKQLSTSTSTDSEQSASSSMSSVVSSSDSLSSETQNESSQTSIIPVPSSFDAKNDTQINENEITKNDNSNKEIIDMKQKPPICQIQASKPTELPAIIFSSSVKSSSEDEELDFKKKTDVLCNSNQPNYQTTEDKKQEILFSMIEQDLFSFNFDACSENVFQSNDFNLFFK